MNQLQPTLVGAHTRVRHCGSWRRTLIRWETQDGRTRGSAPTLRSRVLPCLERARKTIRRAQLILIKSISQLPVERPLVRLHLLRLKAPAAILYSCNSGGFRHASNIQNLDPHCAIGRAFPLSPQAQSEFGNITGIVHSDVLEWLPGRAAAQQSVCFTSVQWLDASHSDQL